MAYQKNSVFYLSFLPLVMCVLLSGCLDGNEVSIDQFHICTVASYEHPNLKKLQQSCEQHNIELEVVGMGQYYNKNSSKLLFMVDYLNTLEDSDIVMFVDGFDVLILEDKATILEKFLAMQTGFLMSAEKNCWPYPDLAKHYPPSPTPFRFINTGSYIGYVKNIKNWLDRMQPIYDNGSDQGFITVEYLGSPAANRPFVLDYYCHLFLPLFLVEENEIVIDEQNQTFFCLTTGSKPSVIHASGESFLIWDKAYKALVH